MIICSLHFAVHGPFSKYGPGIKAGEHVDVAGGNDVEMDNVSRV